MELQVDRKDCYGPQISLGKQGPWLPCVPAAGLVWDREVRGSRDTDSCGLRSSLVVAESWLLDFCKGQC